MSARRIFQAAQCIGFWGCALLAASWWFDPRVPFRLIDASVQPASRGHTAVLNASVWRDLSRGCSVSFSRYLYDSQGIRHTIRREEAMSAAAIAHMDAQSPGRLKVAIPLPERMAAGPARYVTDLQYVCNPLQVLRPVQVLMDVPLEVLP